MVSRSETRVRSTIDTPRDLTLPGAPAEIAGTMEAASVMRRLVAAFRQEGKPIVHLVRLYRPDGSNVDLCRREAIEQGKSVWSSLVVTGRSW